MKIIHLIFFLLVFNFIAYSYCISDKDSTYNNYYDYQKIKKLVLNGKYTDADSILDKLLLTGHRSEKTIILKRILTDYLQSVINKNQINIIYKLYSRLDESLLEQEELESNLYKFQEYMPYLFLIGLNYERNNKKFSAIEIYTQMINFDSTDFLIHFKRGENYFNSDSIDQAIFDLNNSIRLNQNFSLSYFTIGNVYTKIEDYESAYSNYSLIPQAERPSYFHLQMKSAYNNYAAKLIKKGKYDLANKVLSESLVLFEDSIDFYKESIFTNRGTANYKLGNYKLAIEDYNSALLNKADSLEVIKRRSIVYMELSDYKNAMLDLNFILSREPGNLDYLYKLGELHYDNKIYDKSYEVFKKVKSIDPTNLSAIYLCGVSLDYLKQYSEALKEYNSFLSLTNDTNDVRYSFVKRRALEISKSTHK